MQLTTEVEIKKSAFLVEPQMRMLFLGSCFADNIGRCFKRNAFNVDINPQGVMYNPASIYNCLHNLDSNNFDVLFITLGTNYVYCLRQTGEIVANCQKRPAALFEEKELSVKECIDYLQKTIIEFDGKVILTVSPIRYAKYGYHKSRLSKAILLLAADEIVKRNDNCVYFPSYEIVNDELRDYRFYNPDMLHPSQQAVEYIWDKFGQAFFSSKTYQFLQEWKPIREAMEHKHFYPESEEAKNFKEQTENKRQEFFRKWHIV